MARAIGLNFGLGVHRVNINGATMAIFELPSRTQKNELQMAKISSFAEIGKWSISPVRYGNSKIAAVATFMPDVLPAKKLIQKHQSFGL